jgi:hypothetical protein
LSAGHRHKVKKKDFMKRFSLFFAVVLISTGVFANETIEPTATSSFAVTRVAGSSLFKVHYSAYMPAQVKVSIFNESGSVIFSERIKKTDGFIRPYNFNGLEAGNYVIELDNGGNKFSEKVSYPGNRIEKFINIVKLEEGKFLLSAKVKEKDNINVSVYNKRNELVYSAARSIKGDFAQVLNLKKLSGFTIEVTDNNGIVKSLKY